jgi:hypothetical protein
MEESTTYQAIVRKGCLTEARKLLFMFGEEQFGAPSEAARSAINALDNLEQIEQYCKRVTHVGSWDELLARPSRRRRNT